MEKKRVKTLGWLHLFRNLKTGKQFISNLYSAGAWYEVGDLAEVNRDSFEKHGLDIILSHLLKPQQPLPPDDKLSHKEIRCKTRGMKEVTIILHEDEEILIYPVRGGHSMKDGSATVSTNIDQKIFLKRLEGVFEYSRRSL